MGIFGTLEGQTLFSVASAIGLMGYGLFSGHRVYLLRIIAGVLGFRLLYHFAHEQMPLWIRALVEVRPEFVHSFALGMALIAGFALYVTCLSGYRNYMESFIAFGFAFLTIGWAAVLPYKIVLEQVARGDQHRLYILPDVVQQLVLIFGVGA
jgi:hypothetical protein